MNASNLYTRTRAGLDNRVWLVPVIAIIISAALLGFKIATNQSCQPIEILLTNNDNHGLNKYYPQDRISFEAKMNGTQEVEWDFGDNTPKAKGKTLIHSYGAPGSYFVTATVNGKCKEFMSVVINTRFVPTANNPTNIAVLDIVGADAPKAGEPTVYSTGLNSVTYEWNVLNAPEYPTQKTAVATYTFATPGAKVIELKLDNGKVVRKSIQVLPGDKPVVDPNANAMQPDINIQQQQQNINPDPQPEEVKPKSIFIADEVFKDMFIKVAKGEMDASSFNQFLCSGSQTKLRDDDESWTTVGEFCSKIHDKKKYVIKSVITIRNDDNCVKQIKVTYKKKGFLGL
jgi:PKD repeat protein